MNEVSMDDRAEINSALAQLDALAFQALRNYVSRADAVRLWGSAAMACSEVGATYVEGRRMSDPQLWGYLDEFAKLASKRRSVGS